MVFHSYSIQDDEEKEEAATTANDINTIGRAVWKFTDQIIRRVFCCVVINSL